MPATNDQRVSPRLFVILATEAPVGVIFRRGPSKWTRLCKWDTATDTITRGQWFQGRAYERRSDLSPDGKYLVCFAMNGQPGSQAKGNWTVISRLPYWTPLALWPNKSTSGGGGFFLSKTQLFLNQAGDALPGKGPRMIQVTRSHSYETPRGGEDASVYYPRLRRDGWSIVAERSDPQNGMLLWCKKAPRSEHRLFKRSRSTPEPRAGVSSHIDEHALELPTGSTIEMAGVEWADWDHAGRLVFTRDGRLWFSSVADNDLDATQIADFNEDTPGPVPLPAWAQKW